MREIKFRAWNKEKNIMCYEDEDNSAGYLDGWIASDIQVINQTLNSDFTKETYDFMEFTGLKDKNGKEIYEGDIVLYDDWEMSTESGYGDRFRNKGIIEYNESNCCFNVTERTMLDREDVLYEGNEDLEVIGNIYENPELLED